MKSLALFKDGGLPPLQTDKRRSSLFLLWHWNLTTLAKLLVDDGAKGLEGMGADQAQPVDEEGRGAIGAQQAADPRLSFDLLGVFAGIKTLIEGRAVKSEVPGISFE
jgi:hypothetical protein